jgi:hypothetical protein
MIAVFAGDFLHGGIPGHGNLTGAEDWIVIDVRSSGRVMEFGEELTVDLDANFAFVLSDLDAIGGGSVITQQREKED